MHPKRLPLLSQGIHSARDDPAADSEYPVLGPRMASQNASDGKMLSDKDHQCFNAFLECTFEYKNHVADYYTKVAPEYDEFMAKTGYNGPRIVGEIVNDLVEDKSSWLVDICGGTGMSGQEMRKHGFSNIDYIDGSEGMTKQAKLKGIYRNYYCEMLLPGKRSSLEPGKLRLFYFSNCAV
ncbi:hypothetical protein TTRE_0000674601 [Trichuris trichiura]|uniref:Methyltransferase domain-containing protein n=1 Tax=Trichuris trichiura TaxID=36087 RepID=A0A077ZDG2_TRITR|nr:hypothetical protein TTRE_0000674601 [Trichuris trichiura]